MRLHQIKLEEAIQQLQDRTWQLRAGKKPQLLKDTRLTPDHIRSTLDRHVIGDQQIQDIKAVIGFERDWIQTWAAVVLAETTEIDRSK